MNEQSASNGPPRRRERRLRARAAVLSFVLAALASASARASAPPTVVFLNFSDGTERLSFGSEDDSTHNISSLCETDRIGSYWGSSECGDRADCAVIIAESVADYFHDFNVVFTLERPAAGPYTMAVVGPASGTCGFGVEGAGPLDCSNRNPDDVVFAFDCANSVVGCAVTIAHELAHSFGLAHTHEPCDIMAPGSFRCAEPAFFDRELKADNTECGAVQNNYRHLLAVLGPWNGGDSHLLEAAQHDRAHGCGISVCRSGSEIPWLTLFVVAVVASRRRRARMLRP